MKLHKEIINHVKEGLKSNFRTIILGDFNTNSDIYWSLIRNGKSIHWQMEFYQKLFALNFLNLYDICHDTPQPTYNSGPYSSRIDTIFASPNITSEFLFSYIDTPDLYASDHKLVFASFSDFRKQQSARSCNLQNKR